jgi:diguanylate cyclase (GGDEF)-like protein
MASAASQAVSAVAPSISMTNSSPPWLAIVTIFAFGLGMRAWIWNMERDTLTYGFAYQSCYVLASLLAARTTLSIDRRGPLHLALAAVFFVLSAHFLLKPFAAMTLGSGRTFTDYTKTTYAMISQSTSGMLTLAAGLLLLLIVAQKAITESQLASETDPLSGLANRRGFDRLADAALARVRRTRLPLAVALFDLDHFKRVNDTFGHATGDGVIASFAATLRATAPGAAVTARQGGEEFVMLIEGATAETAWLAAEAIRIRTAAGLGADLPAMTVSAGVAQLRPGESLSDLLRRADQATYQAKNSGRDRICAATEDPSATVGLRLVG